MIVVVHTVKAPPSPHPPFEGVMETERHGVKLRPEAPQRRQQGSAEGRGQGQLDRCGSVTPVYGATLETAGVAGAQDGAGQRLLTQV